MKVLYPKINAMRLKLSAYHAQSSILHPLNKTMQFLIGSAFIYAFCVLPHPLKLYTYNKTGDMILLCVIHRRKYNHNILEYQKEEGLGHKN